VRQYRLGRQIGAAFAVQGLMGYLGKYQKYEEEKAMRRIITGLAGLAVAGAVGLAALTGGASEAQAHKRGFGLYAGPGGFSLYVGPRYRYRRYPYYGYYGPRRYYYAPRRCYYGGCSYRARQCARNWGWRNKNWRGCMRYYGCR
jgi:hypothetical protein